MTKKRNSEKLFGTYQLSMLIILLSPGLQASLSAPQVVSQPVLLRSCGFRVYIFCQMQQSPLEWGPRWREFATPRWSWPLPQPLSALHSWQIEPAGNPHCRWCQSEPLILPVIVLAQLLWYKWTLQQFPHPCRCLVKFEVPPTALHQWSPQFHHFGMLEPGLVLQFLSTFQRWTEKWKPFVQRGLPALPGQSPRRVEPQRWMQNPTRCWWQSHRRSCSGNRVPGTQKRRIHTIPRHCPTKVTSRSSRLPPHRCRLPWGPSVLEMSAVEIHLPWILPKDLVNAFGKLHLLVRFRNTRFQSWCISLAWHLIIATEAMLQDEGNVHLCRFANWGARLRSYQRHWGSLEFGIKQLLDVSWLEMSQRYWSHLQENMPFNIVQ